MTIDDQNDAISTQVDAELPRPLGGFEHEKDEDRWKAAQERRFAELVRNQTQTQAAPTQCRMNHSGNKTLHRLGRRGRLYFKWECAGCGQIYTAEQRDVLAAKGDA